MTIAPRSCARRRCSQSALLRVPLFLLAACVLFAPFSFPHAPESRMTQLIGSYVLCIAQASAWLVARFEAGVFATDSGLIVGRYALQIVLDCAALDVHALYLAALVAFPCSFWSKLLAASLGSAAIAACNLLRIVTLYFVGLHAPARFDLLHEDVLALLMVLIAILIFHQLLIRRAPISAAPLNRT
jgi:exosortase/archaeosortase family protein